MSADVRANPFAPYDLTALCLWREARGEGTSGMQAVANVIANRAAKYLTTCDAQVMRPLQFSSMTAPGDKQLLLFPQGADAAWQMAQHLAAEAKTRTLADVTHGATLYYAPRGIQTSQRISLPDGRVIPFPATWNRKAVLFTAQVVSHYFFREVA